MEKRLLLVLGILFCFEVFVYPQADKIDSLQVVLQETKDKDRVDVLNELAQLQRNTDVEQGLITASEALELSKQIAYKEGEAAALHNLGLLSRMKSEYLEAVEYYHRALQIYESAENKLKIAYVHNDMAFCYYDLDQADKLQTGLTTALAIFEEIGDEKGIADVTNNLGIHYDVQGNFDTAVIYYKRSLEMNLRLGAEEEAANCRINLAAVSTLQENYEEAKILIEQADAFYVKSGNTYAQIIVCIERSNLSSALGDYRSAITHAERGLVLANTYGSIHKAMNISSKLIEYYSLIGDAHMSFTYFQMYDELKDSIFNEDNSEVLSELETRYQSDLKEQEILALNLSNQQEKFRRNAFAALSVLIFIVGLLLIIQKRREARNNRLLYDKGQEVEKIKSRFFANITHEFRTPLTLILGPIELLKAKITSRDERKQLDVMELNANRLLDLINQLLDLSKLESGKMKLEAEPTDIDLLIRRVSGLFESVAEIKKISISIENRLQNNLIYLDPDKMDKVLVNLLSNALKFTPAGGSIRITLDTGDSLHIRIKDSGPGIPEEDLRQIFDPYFQSGLSSAGDYPGTGIGLALCKELVELHGGSISAESTAGAGTEFLLTLPDSTDPSIPVERAEKTMQLKRARRRPVLENQAVPAESDFVAGVSAQQPLLLIIEDNQEVREYVRDVVSDAYRIELAMDGQQGLEKALQLIPDLVISDVMMPKMDGFEVCERLKSDEKTSHIPIILLTARASVEDRLEGLTHKADSYLAKPFVPEELQLRIANLIETRRKMSEKFSKEVVLKPGEIKVDSVEELFLEKLKKKVEGNLGNEQLSVDDLAGMLHMSRSQLHRKVKALTNLAPNEFIRNYRLTRAMELIRNNAATTSEIAFDVGFNSPSYFTRCFREFFGYPPSEVRKLQN